MGVETGETIPQLIHTAAALRKARRMRAEFLLRWALQRAAGKQLSDDFEHYTDATPPADVNGQDWRSDARRRELFDD